MYKKVPAEILIKKAIIKCPCPINKFPVISPKTFISPWTITMIVEVLSEYPYFLYIRPNVSP
jgi:hypothetical protein